MKTFAELESLDMNWVKSRTGMFQPASFQLLDHNQQVLATITRSGWGGVATVDAPGNRWTFQRKTRWLKSFIRITSVGTGEEPAECERHGNSSILTYPDGQTFRWKPVSWLSGSKWVWTDADGSPILGIELRGFWQTRGEVHIDPEMDVQKAPPLLLFLGWYLILLHQDEAAATAATIASTTSASFT
ncbi:MAG: hypothetical protein U0670_25165 [Anaerolineae bacterium]